MSGSKARTADKANIPKANNPRREAAPDRASDLLMQPPQRFTRARPSKLLWRTPEKIRAYVLLDFSFVGIRLMQLWYRDVSNLGASYQDAFVAPHMVKFFGVVVPLSAFPINLVVS